MIFLLRSFLKLKSFHYEKNPEVGHVNPINELLEQKFKEQEHHCSRVSKKYSILVVAKKFFYKKLYFCKKFFVKKKKIFYKKFFTKNFAIGFTYQYCI